MWQIYDQNDYAFSFKTTRTKIIKTMSLTKSQLHGVLNTQENDLIIIFFLKKNSKNFNASSFFLGVF